METTNVDIAVKEFLRRGRRQNLTAEELAAACDREVQNQARKSFAKALETARKFAKQAVDSGGILETTAQRTLARMLHLSGKHAEALEVYLSAREASKRNRAVRGKIDRALTDVYMYLGDYQKSRKHARQALRTFEASGAESDLAMSRVNYANLLHRQDRHVEAEVLYRQAADFFATNGNQIAAAKCYYNRANTLVQLFRLEEAEKLYRRAIEIYQQDGYDLDANDSRYGIAWLRMLQGQFHVALLQLSDCERVYRDSGDPRGEALCKLDRAEVYVGLGLFEDANECAQAAEKDFKKLGLDYEKAKTNLFRGQALMGMDRHKEARKHLRIAGTAFEEQENWGLLGAVNLIGANFFTPGSKAAAQSLVEAQNYFERAQLPLWQAVCDLRQTEEPSLADAAFERLSKNRAAQAVPHIFAGWKTSLGDREQQRGNISKARRYWQQAADRLDLVRAQLPPVELRTSWGRRQGQPHLRLIETNLSEDPDSAAIWAERHKTAGVWAPLRLGGIDDDARRGVQEALNELAQQVAAVSGSLGSLSGERHMAAASRNRVLSSLQRKIREQLIRLEEQESSAGTDNEELLVQLHGESMKLPIVQFHLTDADIIAFVHVDGAAKVVRIKSGHEWLKKVLMRWRFVLEGEILAGHLGERSDSQIEQNLVVELGKKLWEPLGIPADAESVLVIPEGELANLPWKAVVIDGKPLLSRHNVILSPSFRHFLAAKKSRTRSRNIAVYRGRADDLPAVDRELESFKRSVDNSVTYHYSSTRGDWPNSDSARIWHYAGHAVLRDDNPFYSYLALADGPLFAADFRLKNCKVNLVTLAACRSGEHVALPGEEATGLVRSLLEMGARNVIAGLWPVSDEATALWMEHFYEKYLSGSTISDSVRSAALAVRESYPSSYHWGAFSLFGAGN